MTAEQARLLNPLVLAFVGDAVQTLYVRENLARSSDSKAGTLHKRASGIVCCTAQAELFDRLSQMLTGEEKEIFHRARNSKNNTAAKNGSLADYKKASGLEAVIGFLYLTGQIERLNLLLSL